MGLAAVQVPLIEYGLIAWLNIVATPKLIVVWVVKSQ
jgi:hypothetical protein